METMTILWLVLGFISILAFIYNFSISNNSILISCIIGLFIGLVIALKSYFKGMEIEWLLLLKGAILGSVIGVIFSFLKRK